MFPIVSQPFPGWDRTTVMQEHPVLKIMPLEIGTGLASIGFLVCSNESWCRFQGKFAFVANPYSIAPASAGVLV
jgi:hypothetical protein